VTRRTREIGVRMALGAHRVDVVGLVVRQALAMTVLGIVVGAALAYPITRVLGRFLFEISPHDPVAFVGAGAVLCVLALLASYVPATRAARVDPLTALRTE
jgi:putative ABC transport system permease protein